jgi:hypothetical protein
MDAMFWHIEDQELDGTLGKALETLSLALE